MSADWSRGVMLLLSVKLLLYSVCIILLVCSVGGPFADSGRPDCVLGPGGHKVGLRLGSAFGGSFGWSGWYQGWFVLEALQTVRLLLGVVRISSTMIESPRHNASILF